MIKINRVRNLDMVRDWDNFGHDRLKMDQVLPYFTWSIFHATSEFWTKFNCRDAGDPGD